MHNVGKRVKSLRLKLGLSQAEFAMKSGISVGGICEIEKGKRGLTNKTILRICKAFNVDSDWLLTGHSKHKELPGIVAESRTEYDIKKLTAIPVINDVPAGYPEYPVLDDEIRDHVYLPRVPRQAFGLYVSGDSMKPEINNGDIVIVNPNIQEVKKGEIGVFRINAETTVKYCVPLDDGFLLQPANPSYKPILVSGDIECTVIGKVIYKIVKC